MSVSGFNNLSGGGGAGGARNGAGPLAPVSTAASGSNGDVSETLYERLGVAESATPEEIKVAYYRLVRQYRPSEYPDIFAGFSEASRVLTDTRRRGEYDQNRRSGRRVQVLLDQAAAALDKDALKAVTLLKSAIAFAPDMARPRQLLAHVLMKLEDYPAAERQYRWLIRESPRDETLHLRLARCLNLQQRHADAAGELRNALKLNPCYHDALILLSRIYENMGDEAASAQALEQAVANDERENFADFDALLRLYVLALQAEDQEKAAQAERRLLAVVPSQDPEKGEKAVRRLLARSEEFYAQGRFDAAEAMARAATAITVSAETAAEAGEDAREMEQRSVLSREAARACDDPLLGGVLKEGFRAKYLTRGSESVRRQKMEAVIYALQQEIQEDPRGLGGAVEYVRREYPHIAADQDALLQELLYRVARRVEFSGPDLKGGDPLQPAVMPTAGARNGAADQKRSRDNNGRKGFMGWLRGGSGGNGSGGGTA